MDQAGAQEEYDSLMKNRASELVEIHLQMGC